MAPPPALPVHPPSGPHHDSKPPKKSQKEMTKAERKELQERQRAAKAEAKASGQPSSSTPAQKKSNKPAEIVPRPPPTPGRAPREATRGAAAVAHETAAGANERGLRIFSHFGLPKAVSAPKGDIHPVTLRLALQFSEFKIVGANARCIATLIAFKTVCSLLHASVIR